jgi:hypothetical protein
MSNHVQGYCSFCCCCFCCCPCPIITLSLSPLLQPLLLLLLLLGLLLLLLGLLLLLLGLLLLLLGLMLLLLLGLMLLCSSLSWANPWKSVPASLAHVPTPLRCSFLGAWKFIFFEIVYIHATLQCHKARKR